MQITHLRKIGTSTHRWLFLFAVFFLVGQIGCATMVEEGSNQGAPNRKERVRIILDSDMAGDVDDVGALATLHALADRGHANILAVGSSERNPWTPLCMDAINTYYGHPEIPIGTTKDPDAFRKKSKYTKQIAMNFPRSRNWNVAPDVPPAVEIYRSVLARQPDDSVVIVTIGSLANVSNLLRSEPGEHSKLSGDELVEQKVRHWVAMAGTFGPKEGKPEANLIKGVDYAQHAVKQWPTNITFSGAEIGGKIKTGPALKKTPEDNPVRRAYELYNNLTHRSSFDQAATLYAVRGLDGGQAAAYWSFSEWGRVKVHDDGSSTFKRVPDGNHRYMKQKRDPDEIANELEALMTHPPGDD